MSDPTLLAAQLTSRKAAPDAGPENDALLAEAAGELRRLHAETLTLRRRLDRARQCCAFLRALLDVRMPPEEFLRRLNAYIDRA